MSAGWHGVDLFFVLSGFVLMLTHAQDFVSLKGDVVVAFWKSRAARVYPLSWIVLLLITVVVLSNRGAVEWYQTLNAKNYTLLPFIKTALLANRWGFAGDDGDWNQPVWSLSIEVVGYALFPVVAWRLTRRSAFWRAMLFAGACLALLALIQVISGTAGINKIGFKAALTRMSLGFFSGAALAHCLAVCPDWLRRICPTLAMLSCLAIILIGASHMAEWAMTSCFAILVFSVSAQRGSVQQLLGLPIMMFLGRISFPLYLLHVTPLLLLVYNLRGVAIPVWTASLIFLAYLIACLALAFLLHVTVERPSHRWGRRWAALASFKPRPMDGPRRLELIAWPKVSGRDRPSRIREHAVRPGSTGAPPQDRSKPPCCSPANATVSRPKHCPQKR